jgi:hypothetical protein
VIGAPSRRATDDFLLFSAAARRDRPPALA